MSAVESTMPHLLHLFPTALWRVHAICFPEFQAVFQSVPEVLSCNLFVKHFLLPRLMGVLLHSPIARGYCLLEFCSREFFREVGQLQFPVQTSGLVTSKMEAAGSTAIIIFTHACYQINLMHDQFCFQVSVCLH